MAWLPGELQNGGLRSRFFQNEFLPDSMHFQAETSVNGKFEYLLGTREDKRSELFGATSFKNRNNSC